MSKSDKFFHVSGSLKILIIIIFAVCTIMFYQDICIAIKNALLICVNTIIPALFPALLISYMLSLLQVPDKILKRIHKITKAIFGLSGNCITAIISGLFFGYNSAYYCSELLYNKKLITKEEAGRISLCFTCPGISYCVLITGLYHYKSISTGVILLISNITACIIHAVIFNMISKSNTFIIHPNRSEASLSDLLTQSVSSTSHSLISICAWIIVSNIFIRVAESLIGDSVFVTLIKILTEVSYSVDFCCENFSIYSVSFILSAGCLCIFLQQIPSMKSLSVKIYSGLFHKLINAVLSVIIFRVISAFFPIETIVFSSNTLTYKDRFSFSPVGSVSMLLFLMFNIFCQVNERSITDNKITKKTNYITCDKKKTMLKSNYKF